MGKFLMRQHKNGDDNHIQHSSFLKFFYCPSTGQHFSSYANLMRYVSYAQEKRVSIYQPAIKRVKRIEYQEEIRKAPKFKKTGMLALPKKPSSNSNSSTAELNLDPKPSTLSGSAGKEKDPDYVPKSEIDVTADQKLNEEYDNQN